MREETTHSAGRKCSAEILFMGMGVSQPLGSSKVILSLDMASQNSV